MVISSLVHFLLAECRIIWAFYASMMTLISQSASSLVLGNKLIDEYPTQFMKNATANTLAACVIEGVQEAIKSLNVDFASKNGCVQIPVNYFGYMTWITRTICTLLFLVCMKLYFSKGASWDYRSGAYIAFSFHLERYPLYQHAAKLVVVWVIIGFGCLFRQFAMWSYHGHSGTDFVTQNWPLAFGLIGSAAGLLQTPQPILFNYETESFRKMTFNRTKTQMLTQSNNAFATVLQNAILTSLKNPGAPGTPDVPSLADLMPNATSDDKAYLLSNEKGDIPDYLQHLLPGSE